MNLLLICVSQIFFGHVINHSLKSTPVTENRLTSHETGQPVLTRHETGQSVLTPKSISQAAFVLSSTPWSALRLKKSIREAQQKPDDDGDDDKTTNNNDGYNENNDGNNNNNNNVNDMKVSNINNGSLQYKEQGQRNCSLYNETYTTEPSITEIETCRMCICEETAVSDPTFIPFVAPISQDLKVPVGLNEAKTMSYAIQCMWVPCMNISLAVNSSTEANNTEIFFTRTGFRVGKCLIAVGAVIACLLIAALLLSVHRFCQNRAHLQLHSQYEDDMY